MRGHVFIERHLLRLMAPPPPPPTVRGLCDDDAIDPGAQCRLAPELAKGTKHPQKDFLGEVKRFLRIGKKVQGELIDHALVIGHQTGAGCLVSRQAFLRSRPVRGPLGLSFGHAGGFGPRESSDRSHGCFLNRNTRYPG